MDSILFYGDRGEESRRQVRSAAAQHSHRIGPRKPKSSNKRVRSETPTRNKRPLRAAAHTFISLGPANLERRKKSSSTSFAGSNSPPNSANATASSPDTPSKVSNTSTPTTTHQERGRQQPTPPQQIRWKQVQGIQQGQLQLQPQPQQAPAKPSNPGPRPPPQSQAPPLPPPLVIERIPNAANSTVSRSRQRSTTSPVSPSTRLPQYSWTEYPRYGTSFRSLQMLARVAVADQEATTTTIDQRPTSGESNAFVEPVPGFRQYVAEPPATDESHEMMRLPEPARDSTTTFGAFLQRAANGQECVDDAYNRRRCERHEVDIKREALPEG